MNSIDSLATRPVVTSHNVIQRYRVYACPAAELRYRSARVDLLFSGWNSSVLELSVNGIDFMMEQQRNKKTMILRVVARDVHGIGIILRPMKTKKDCCTFADTKLMTDV